MANRRISPLKNLVLVALSFLLIFGAYMALEAVQSSLNTDVGVQSLCATYASLVFFSVFLPPLVIGKLGYTKSMGVSVVGYMLYTSANFHPQPYLLIPAGIILGASASVLWASMRVYVTDLSFYAAQEKGTDKEKSVGEYFGIFFFVYNFSGLGGVIMSLLLTDWTDDNSTIVNVTSSNISGVVNAGEITSNFSSCGEEVTGEWSPPEDEKNSNVNKLMLNILLGVYVVFAAIAWILITFALDEVPTSRTETHEAEKKLREEDGEEISKDKLRNRSKRSTKALVQATARLILGDSQLHLIIPQTIQCGYYSSFIMTFFLKFWVTCSVGIEYVGYIAVSFSVVCSLTSALFGRALRVFHRITLFCIAFVIEGATLVVLMLWSPSKEDASISLFFVYIAVVAFSYQIHKCIIQTVYSCFFTKDPDAAQSANSFFDSAGKVVLYGLAPVVSFKSLYYTQIGLLILAVITYCIAEKRHTKMRSKQEELPYQRRHSDTHRQL